MLLVAGDPAHVVDGLVERIRRPRCVPLCYLRTCAAAAGGSLVSHSTTGIAMASQTSVRCAGVWLQVAGEEETALLERPPAAWPCGVRVHAFGGGRGGRAAVCVVWGEADAGAACVGPWLLVAGCPGGGPLRREFSR